MKQAIKQLDQAFPDDALEKYRVLLDELQRWNKKVNLTAIRDRDEMVAAHLLDSLVARPLLHGVRILDVGTGEGLLWDELPNRVVGIDIRHQATFKFAEVSPG